VAVKFAPTTATEFSKEWLNKGGSRRKEELIKTEVDKLTQKGFVERSTAAGSAPVLLVKKPMIDPSNKMEKPR